MGKCIGGSVLQRQYASTAYLSLKYPTHFLPF